MVNKHKNEIIEILKSLIGQKVIYSRAGGGAGSILRQEYQNGVCIWSWSSYWEIIQRAVLIACSDDEDVRPHVGVIATGAKIMESKRLLGFDIDDTLTLALFFEDDIDYIIFPQKYKSMELDNWEITAKKLNVVYELNNNLEIIKRSYRSDDNCSLPKTD